MSGGDFDGDTVRSLCVTMLWMWMIQLQYQWYLWALDYSLLNFKFQVLKYSTFKFIDEVSFNTYDD